MPETPQRRAERLARLADELRLTPMERRFAEVYAADPEQNQAAAARAAGYKQDRRMGSLVVARDNVRRYVEALKTEAQQAANAHTANAIMDAAEIEEWLARVKRVNIPAAVRRAKESGDLLAELEAVGDLIENVRIPKLGIEVRVTKHRAVALAARIRGILKDRVELTGKDDGPIVIRELLSETGDADS